MSDPTHPTGEWELFDPLEVAPPTGVTLLVINEGGTLHKAPWYDGALAWGYLPKIPASVKKRQAEQSWRNFNLEMVERGYGSV